MIAAICVREGIGTAVIGYNIWCACVDSAGFPARTMTAYSLPKTSLIA